MRTRHNSISEAKILEPQRKLSHNPKLEKLEIINDMIKIMGEDEYLKEANKNSRSEKQKSKITSSSSNCKNWFEVKIRKRIDRYEPNNHESKRRELKQNNSLKDAIIGLSNFIKFLWANCIIKSFKKGRKKREKNFKKRKS